MNILRVPGARLYYEVEGDGPTLLLIPGGATDSMIFDDVRKMLAEYYSVVTYDPRGISFSPLDGAPSEQDLIREHADDVQRLLAATGTEPACVFAHSSGALTAMDHIVRHPEQVRTLVLYEPTIHRYVVPIVLGVFGEQGVSALRARKFQELIRIDASPTPRNPSPAVLQRLNCVEDNLAYFLEFRELMGLDALPPPRNPSPAVLQHTKCVEDNLTYFFDHLLPAVVNFAPDLDALRAVATRIVVGVGEKSAGRLVHKTTLALAADLGLTAVSFPGDHNGFAVKPIGFAMQLRRVLAQCR
jgi:pimeloyl-ACP methyl ester carboxylesterase